MDPRWAELEGTNSREQYSEQMGPIIKDTWELDDAGWGHRMLRRWRESAEKRKGPARTGRS